MGAHSHGHEGHDHGQDRHGHEKAAQGGKMLVALLLTAATLVAEIVGGILTGSLALLSDAAHVFLDIFALALSYGAIRLATRPPSARHSYGFFRMKVLAAFVNGASLLVVSIEIFREGITRLANPAPVVALPMLVVATIGLAANLIVALVLGGHDHEDLNARAAFLHVIGDALSSVGVIVAGLIIAFTGWYWVDPVASLLIGIIIITGSFRVLKEAIHLLNEGAPEGAGSDEVGEAIAGVPGVLGVHDAHVWSLDPSYRLLSAHVVLEDLLLSRSETIMTGIKKVLDEKFEIEHTTIQFECSNCGQCSEPQA